ncbi:hypothetical protein MmazTMA_15130 [Methanosarcina mazei]|nr:hypothetical protein MmazTMA_15130 [Methanosarcina mazei]
MFEEKPLKDKLFEEKPLKDELFEDILAYSLQLSVFLQSMLKVNQYTG